MFSTLDLSFEPASKTSPDLAAGGAPRRLILSRLPVRRNLPGTKPVRAEAELPAARAALADPRSAGERALDGVVDRLLEELTW